MPKSDFTFKAISEIRRRLNGLPSFCRLVIYECLEYCDIEKGLITLETLNLIASRDFFVERAPGRKREDVNENTLRNAFRTIKKFKGNDFIFRLSNQRIEIEMPWMRDLYLNFCDQNKDAAVNPVQVNASETLENTDQICIFSDKNITQNRTEVASKKDSVKNINNKYINNNNNKSPIHHDFYPKPETISRAEALGYSDASDLKEIQAFIDHNTATGSQFADFNPIYLRWLARRSERKAQQLKKENHTGRTRHASSRCKSYTHQPSALDRVKQAYANQFELNETTGQFMPKAFINATSHCNVMAPTC